MIRSTSAILLCLLVASCGGGGPDAGTPPFSSGGGGLSPAPTPGTRSLTVTVVGVGSVISSPVGVQCSSKCTTSFPPGTTVQLTATPGTGAVFSGWSEDCTGQSCTVSMSADHKVTATFR